jgi:hypothetical protein
MGSTQSSGAIHDHGYARRIRVIDKTCFSSAVNLMNIVNVAELLTRKIWRLVGLCTNKRRSLSDA